MSVWPGAERIETSPAAPGDEAPLAHPERCEALRNAARLARSLEHPLLPRLHTVVETPVGPMLVYDWVEGELLHSPAPQRADPRSAFQRFRALPARRIERALDDIYALHVALVERGWIAVDFYDGSLIHDFARGEVHAVDLDLYHPGAFRNEMGRMWGSTRFMAPEELERGRVIDQRTTVFTLGRAAAVLLSDGTLERASFRGSDARHAVVSKACAREPARRFGTVAEFSQAWGAAGEPEGSPAPARSSSP